MHHAGACVMRDAARPTAPHSTAQRPAQRRTAWIPLRPRPALATVSGARRGPPVRGGARVAALALLMHVPASRLVQRGGALAARAEARCGGGGSGGGSGGGGGGGGGRNGRVGRVDIGQGAGRLGAAWAGKRSDARRAL